MLPDSLAGFKGPTSKGGEGRGKEKGKGRVGQRVSEGKAFPCSDFTI